MPETRPSHSRKCLTQQGFTLLELVLVLFLIGLLASAGLLFTENIESQAKYEETQKRIAIIKRAIVGDLTRTVNGGPELSGFVADVGRLPLCLRELIELPSDFALGGGLYRSPCDIEEPHDTEFDLSLWKIDPATGVGAGWRGPYIQASVESDGQRRFRDGYSNPDDPNVAVDPNFGWNWQLATGLGEVDTIGLTPPLSAVQAKYIHLQSDGFDIGTDNDDVPFDGNEFLLASDWLFFDGQEQPEKATIPLRFTIDEPLPAAVEIDSYLERSLVNNAFLSESISAAQISIAASSDQSHPDEATFNRSIPMGRYKFRLQCNSATCLPESYVITILPRQTLAPLEFRIIP